ncbi:hypothetical protein M0R45_036109 [Rubus argutus]|uniref:Uncharacterized protein n=1 Tax=Rubus argutus TaxID=59490 RepID=A0AAW1VV55_RUBAR
MARRVQLCRWVWRHRRGGRVLEEELGLVMTPASVKMLSGGDGDPCLPVVMVVLIFRCCGWTEVMRTGCDGWAALEHGLEPRWGSTTKMVQLQWRNWVIGCLIDGGDEVLVVAVMFADLILGIEKN